MGRYVLLGFGLVTLIIAVDTASGRRLGCPASTPDICYTCPMPSFVGSDGCQPTAVCPIPCESVAAPACSDPPAATSTSEQQAASQQDSQQAPETRRSNSQANDSGANGDRTNENQSSEAQSNDPQPEESLRAASGSTRSESSVLSRQPAVSDEGSSSDVASPAPDGASASSPGLEARPSTSTGESVDRYSDLSGDRYSERAEDTSSTTRPLFRRPSIESVLPDPVPLPNADAEAASEPSALPETTGPLIFDSSEPVDEASAREASPSTTIDDASSESRDEALPEPSDGSPREAAEPAAAEPAPAEASEASPEETEPTEQKTPAELSPEDYFGPARTSTESPLSVALEMPRRQWCDATGLYECEAQLVAVTQTGVTLETAAGQRSAVPWSRLSTSDLRHVRRQIARVRTAPASDEVIAGGY